MSKDIKLEKVKRYAKNLRIVTSVFFWVTIVLIALSAIVAIAINFIPKEYLTAKYLAGESISFNFNGGLKFYPTKDSIPENADFTRVIMSIIGATATYCLALSLILKQICQILKTVETGTPFENGNAQRLLNIGAVLLGGSVFFNAINGLVTVNIISLLNIDNFNYNLSPDLFMLFTGLLIFVLAGIFKYGAYLQNEYDTTL